MATPNVAPSGVKSCHTCKIEKPLSEFNPRYDRKIKFFPNCKECLSKYNRARRQETVIESPNKRIRTPTGRYVGAAGICNSSMSYVEFLKIKDARRFATNPEKVIANRIAKQVKVTPGLHRHHWSYQPEHAKDIIQLPVKDHGFIHRHLRYDKSTLSYRTVNGELLDSREKHEAYITGILAQKSNQLN